MVLDMNKKVFRVFIMVCFIIIIIVYIFDGSAINKKINKIDYQTFVKNANQVFSKELPDHYSIVSDNKMLNKDYTGFWGEQKLDSRSNDSINGEMKEPSKYQFYFVNEEKTILVQLNLIYEPSYIKTKIIATTSHTPDDVSYFDRNYSSITDIYTIGYLIAFNGGIAKVDFMLINNNDTKINDKSLYLLQEGVHKFMPFIEDLLLSYNNVE